MQQLNSATWYGTTQSNSTMSRGIISGKYYNRSWYVHACFAEAVDGLFCETHIRNFPQVVMDSLRKDLDKQEVVALKEENPFTD